MKLLSKRDSRSTLVPEGKTVGRSLAKENEKTNGELARDNVLTGLG